ncbi:MAG: deoxyribonuclease IV [Planctomycetes bacterium]|nr:deoxyribonuclease IV [Planctomycetota bacterium]
MSIAGGVVKAVERAVSVGGTALQIFTSSSNQWHARDISEGEAAAFRDAVAAARIVRPFAHNTYLVNLASPKPDLWEKSIGAMEGEVRRAEALGLSYLVMHPGSHVGTGEESGLERIAEAVNRLHAKFPDLKAQLCFEVTAGQGTNLGCRFEHLARLFDQIEAADRMGVCLDTCHLFASGYDISTAEGWKKVTAEFDRVVGVRRIRCFHLNDSKKGLGCRVDRHEQIGKGAMGLEAFRAILNDPRFRECPMVLETPKGEDLAEDHVNLAALRGLLA